MKNSSTGGFWYAFNITASILILLFVIATPLLQAFSGFAQSVDITATSIEETPAVFAPTSLVIDIQNESGTPLNAIEFELHYDPKDLLLTAIVPTGVLCEERFVISNSINNASGTALFQCGTVTPFSEARASIATVYMIPISNGTTSISFGELTHVLAHDGLGTDATRERNDLIFTTL